MKDITVKPDINIRQAMKTLSQSGEKCLVIIDEKKVLLGTLSDGDVRKAILKGTRVGDSIRNIYYPKPTVLVKGEYSIKEAKKLFTQYKFDLIPVVDEKGTLKDVLFWETVFKIEKNQRNKKLNVPVVIMAGGKGSRLETPGCHGSRIPNAVSLGRRRCCREVQTRRRKAVCLPANLLLDAR